MLLIALPALPLAGALLAAASARAGPHWPRRVALAALVLEFAFAAALVQLGGGNTGVQWIAVTDLPWIDALGVRLSLAADGLALLMVLLTAFLGGLAVACPTPEAEPRSGFFHTNLLAAVAGATGVFLAVDLFLFFVCWELMLVPMYLLIGIWGHAGRRRAALKFFLFTQGASLPMLAAIVALALAHRAQVGWLSFAYADLRALTLPPELAFWAMLGFFVAFAVKLPMLPLHGWLPDAHTEAPTAASVLLAGVLLKTGAYGLIRFALPLFPAASATIAPWAMGLGATGVLYGALLAFAQDDFKRLVAYTSVSHLGFVLLGIYAGNTLALEGAVVQMLAHGFGTGALFLLAGLLQARLGTRDLARLGGLRARLPRFAAFGLFFVLAALGLPGLGSFIGEFLVLLGAWAARPALAAVAAAGLVGAAIYALTLVHRSFEGPPAADTGADLAPREAAVLALLAAALLGLGLHPQPVLDLAASAVATALGTGG